MYSIHYLDRFIFYQMTSYTPSTMAKAYLSDLKKFELYDAVATFSSVEHSGLGRFGDGINPWGDLITMAKIWCLLKEDGSILLELPTGPRDRIEYNAHR